MVPTHRQSLQPLVSPLGHAPLGSPRDKAQLFCVLWRGCGGGGGGSGGNKPFDLPGVISSAANQAYAIC